MVKRQTGNWNKNREGSYSPFTHQFARAFPIGPITGQIGGARMQVLETMAPWGMPVVKFEQGSARTAI